jgi:hypothetical protein
MVQPPLTEADRASMALQALQNQRREEQQVRVTFNDRPEGVHRAATTPRTPEEVLRAHRGDRAGNGRPGSEQPGSERSGNEQPGSEQPRAEPAASDRPPDDATAGDGRRGRGPGGAGSG